MIRGAFVVTPQAPGQRPPPSSTPSLPWPDTESSLATSSPTSHWVMPAASEPSKWRFPILLFGTAALLFGLAIAAVLNASPVATEGFGIDTSDTAASWADLRVGECFDVDETSYGTIEDVTRRSCDREHQYELFMTESLTGVGYPTDSEFDVVFEDVCVPAFEAYVGAPFGSSVLDIYWLVPNREGWRQGDRTVQCAVYHPAIPRLTAPLKGVGPSGWLPPTA
jgi:hypothetical protein